MSAVYSVSDLNKYVGEVISADPVLTSVRVRGEISGCKQYPSGHIYFTLKDKESQVSCVAFRGNAIRFSFAPDNGLSVIITARASIYDRDGRFQLVVYEMEKDGIGDLFVAFEQLKRRLEAEGLFDVSHKVPIPALPRRIGVITSPKGAVIQDIIHVLSRRFPNFDLLIYPSSVQGQKAAEELKSGIMWFNRTGLVDVIMIARGGGSMEDLWCFNDESLAREIYASKIPVISAVGHEVDFTICDFVSDLRAPTPSAAAELVMPLKSAYSAQIHAKREQLTRALLQNISARRHQLALLISSRSLSYPLRRIESETQRLDLLSWKLVQSIRNQINRTYGRLEKAVTGLDALSPLKVLSRGYSLSTNPLTGISISSISQISTGQPVQIELADGYVDCKAEKTRTRRPL
jgi:exodeoxyribonuclease VII large subunit